MGESRYKTKYQWIQAAHFHPSIVAALRKDCEILLQVLRIVPEWDAGTDRKLDALVTLCARTHTNEKLLIFTQFKDTADYLHREFANQGIQKTAEVFGDMDDISGYVKRFSPVSNGETPDKADEIRVLITTDTLSEGQNLQDAHIVVNFDLPWAIIRLVQRAGRVDRIGQKAREILCYCFLPEDGIEKVIKLRERLTSRIHQSAELIGSDEKFFEGDTVNLHQVYEETMSLEDQEDETDLISRAYDIWHQATKDNSALKKRIETLPDVVYSSKQASEERGALAYIKTSAGQHILTQVNERGEVLTQSQSKVLNLLECQPDEPTAKVAENHHDIVAAAVSHLRKGQAGIGGQLGGKNSIRNRVYTKLTHYLESRQGTLFYSNELKQAVEQIYHYPLKETARDKLGRQLRAGIPDHDLATMVLTTWESGDLSAVPRNDEPVEPHIICSMGLIGEDAGNTV